MIGFGQFDEENDFRQLKSVQHNMEILSDILTKSDGGSGLFQKRNIRQLIDQPATAAQQAVDNFLNKANPEDNLMIYLMGHGVVSHEQSDLAMPSRSANKNHAISSDNLKCLRLKEDIIDRVDQSKCKTLCLLLDCCHASYVENAVSRSSQSTSGMVPDSEIGEIDDLIKSIKEEKRFFIVSSSNANQSAYEQRIDYSILASRGVEEHYKSLGVEQDAYVSRFISSLYETSISSKLSSSEIDETSKEALTDEEYRKIISRDLFRKIFQSSEPDDDGIVSINGAVKGAGIILAELDPPQSVAIHDPSNSASSFPFYIAPVLSRKQKLNQIRSFAIGFQCLTDDTRSSLLEFIDQASERRREDCLNSDLLYERDLYDAMRADEHGMFVEAVLRKGDQDIVSREVNAALQLNRREQDERIEDLHQLSKRLRKQVRSKNVMLWVSLVFIVVLSAISVMLNSQIWSTEREYSTGTARSLD